MVSVRDVVKSFGPKTVLHGVNLEVAKGEIVAVMGSSGGGKTTLLKCVAGLIAPDSGSVKVAGLDVRLNTEEARKKMGMVFQSSALFDYMNVADNVLFGARRRIRMSPRDEKERLARLLSDVELTDAATQLPNELSGGMRKRVGIARALALDPEVMLYDEPTTGLDPVTTYTIDALIARLAKRYEVTSLVVSHDVTSVCRLADRIAFLHEGRLIFDGSPEEFHRSNEPPIRELVDKSEAVALE
jgi:phospholipid/cholesterol/gamma-HCH transport system ATP-binding protein